MSVSLRVFLFALLGLSLFATACQSTSSADQSAQGNTSGDLLPPDQPACSNDQSAILTEYLDSARLGNPGFFPYVYQGNGRSNLFEAYTMRFQLCYDPLFLPMTNDQIPWIRPDRYSEMNGQFVTYVRTGREVTMTDPYVSVQYISKNLPSCSTADSMFIFWDSYYLKEDNESQVIMPMQTTKTRGNFTAYCKEYETRPKTAKIAGKHLAYAYVDYNEEYFIALVLTTVAMGDWELNRPLFYKLVRSLDRF